MKIDFEKRLQEIKQKCTDELAVSRNDLVLKYKKENGLFSDGITAICTLYWTANITSPTELQYEKMKQEKEEAQQDLERMYKRKLIDADVKIR